MYVAKVNAGRVVTEQAPDLWGRGPAGPAPWVFPPEHSMSLQSGEVGDLPLRDSDSCELRGRDSNPDYLIQSQASYH
jgi:hypothetical protein